MFRVFLVPAVLLTTLLSALAPSAPAQRASVGYIVETVAGSAPPKNAALAVDTWLDFPRGVAADAAGSVYVSDSNNHRVIRIRPDGSQENYVGTGERGFSGDGGAANEAQIAGPLGLSIGPDGSLYVADNGNSRVRRVSPGGIITTVAGSGAFQFGGDGGPALEAGFSFVAAAAADAAGNLYIADATAERVRKVDAMGTITTFAGDGTNAFGGDGGPAAQAQLSRPQGVAVGPDQKVYISDTTNDRIRVVDLEGNISTFAGGGDSTEDGVPTDYRLRTPLGLTVDSAGVVYIANQNGQSIVRSTATLIEKVAGSGFSGSTGDGGPAPSALLAAPQDVGLVESGGDVTAYFCSAANNSVRAVRAGIVTKIAGVSHLGGDGGPAAEALLDGPSDLALDGAGNLFIADEENNVVRMVRAADGVISTVAGIGVPGRTNPGGQAAETALNRPRNVLVANDGDLLIADSGNIRILRVDQDGVAQHFAGDGFFEFRGDGGPATEARLQVPIGLAEDAEGNVYIADPFADRIRRVGLDGVINTVVGTGEEAFSGDGGAATDAALDDPTEVVVDEAGNLYFTDNANQRIRRVTTGGMIETVVGGGAEFVGEQEVPALEARVRFPDRLALAPADPASPDERGDIFYTSFSQVYRVSADGMVSKVAGTGRREFGGDGGPALEAAFNIARGLAVAADGSVYVADQENNRVRKLTPVVTSISSGGVVNAGAIAFSAEVDHVSPEAIVSIFGLNLASADGTATALPLPFELAGVTVEVTDSQGATRQARLFAVRANQINCLIPAGTAPGRATLTVRNPIGRTSIEIEVAAVSPGLFTLSGSGQGLAAATAFRRGAEGVDTQLPVFAAGTFPFEAAPIDLGSETDLAVLSLFGTGIRGFTGSIEVTIGGEAAQVLGAAPSSEFEGLDQINVLIPRSLIGRGEVEIAVTVDGVSLNLVTAAIL